VLQTLLGAGAKLEARNDLGNTPLLAAVTARQVEAAKFLISKGADLRIRNSAAQTAADIAGQTGEPKLVALFGAKP
jgi:ankyrin repeat protein